MATAIDLEIICSVCGSALDADVAVSPNPYEDLIVSVEPCETCLDNAREEGGE